MNQPINLCAKANPYYGYPFSMQRLVASVTRVGLLVASILSIGANSSEMAADNPIILLDTSLGPIEVELDTRKAPISSANFLKLVRGGHYNGLVFHRVVSDFVIQTGGYDPDLKEREAPRTIVNEAGNGLSNVRGSLGMARSDDPDSAAAQFYINLKDNLGLDKTAQSAGYAVFGRVVKGMDVVDAIGGAPTHKVSNAMANVPKEPIVIHSAMELKTTSKTDDAE